MHRLPTTIAVAVFSSPDKARVLQATRRLDGHLVFRAASVELTDTPLLVDRLGLPPDALLFTRKAHIAEGRDIFWRTPDESSVAIDLRIDEPACRMMGIADGSRLLAGHRDHAVPALVMAMALLRLAAALQLPMLAEIGIADLIEWLPPRPQPPSPPPPPAPLSIMQAAFARAAFLQKGLS